jgi:ankyrin repeat protein
MEGRRELEDADDKQILSTINSPATRYGEGMDSITATSSAPSQSSGSKPDIPVEVVTRSRSVPTDFIYLVQKYRSKPESRKRFISNSMYGDGGARHDSPLISAINFGRKESVRKVLAREADVKALGCDALCTAARLGYWEIIEVLLESGADINITRDQPGVALIAAAGAGQLEIVQVLLAAGADVTVMHGYHATATALIVAACAGQLEIVQLLLAAGADVNITDDHRGTALIAAAGAGQLEIVQVLLAAGANVNVTDDYCGTALIVTAGAGQLETVKVLLAAGADFNITNGYRGTALHVAAAKGDLEMVGFLLDRGVDANIAAGWDGTALQAAAFYGYVPVMRILLENGADVNSRSGYWKSPLTAATYMGKEQAVQLLLEMGADPNSPMPEYETVGILEMARLRGFTKIVQMLVNRSGLVGFRESIRQQVVQPNQNKPCVWPVGSQLRVDARWEIPGMLKAMDPVNTQLAPVLTISGTLTKAEAATCEEYMKRRWPKSGHFLMTAISHAVTELCSGPSLHSTKLYRFFSSNILPDFPSTELTVY